MKKGNLPPLGPAWAGAALGTGGLATLSRLHGWNVVSALALILAAALILAILAGWARHRIPPLQRVAMPAWALLGMSITTVGTAQTALTHQWWLHAALVVLGAIICVSANISYWPVLRKEPNFLSLFPVMSPVVPAVGFAQWAASGELAGASIARAVGWALCALAITGAIPAFILVYRRMLPLGPPAPLAATCWIPLGIVGQSVVAVLTLGGPRAYGWVVLGIGVPLACWAAWRHWSSIPQWAPYNPTWWASTFPVATCGAGAFVLSGGSGALHAVSLGLLCLLVVHWLLAASRAASHLLQRTS
ncbi:MULTISPECIES: tellurite resistance protein [unclassified Corynebacterium]|uniref:SLAC1 family transporter n=1 Tax=unclassified Corynebacterium TaxID=2624378 RepID=UPI0029CA23A0|nr:MULTISPECIES: tellurite resistance protein [unclassified Corynebacterium]WPF67161.1 tellurite resistance protein [Corynebacterium sp. 22KM0430]WPF69650.1 tellurite resistance protein [Corynebacterium sp. 21KM1197]